MRPIITIAVDAMGGDHGPSVVLPACFKALARRSNLHLILVGDERSLQSTIARLPSRLRHSVAAQRYSIHHASQVVGMSEKPALALRHKKDSSMRVALDLVKQGKADAFVSAGNTGAMVAISRFVLKTPAEISRPAIIKTLPTVTGRMHMIDLGANVDCSADNFLEFAIMGSILSGALDGKKRPRVGLLNIGAEGIKGNEQVKQANQRLIAAKTMNYIGYVEADQMFEGGVDVVVCDGFVGNVALKTMEGMVKLMRETIKSQLTLHPVNRLFSLMSLPLWMQLRQLMNTGNYNGASMIGLNGVVVKSHGNADVDSFHHAILRAEDEVLLRIPQLIQLNAGRMGLGARP